LLKAADKKLMDLIEEGIIDVAKVLVMLAEEERSTEEFYIKHGFKDEGASDDYYRDHETAYRLGKTLR